MSVSADEVVEGVCWCSEVIVDIEKAVDGEVVQVWTKEVGSIPQVDIVHECELANVLCMGLDGLKGKTSETVNPNCRPEKWKKS